MHGVPGSDSWDAPKNQPGTSEKERFHARKPLGSDALGRTQASTRISFSWSLDSDFFRPDLRERLATFSRLKTPAQNGLRYFFF